MIFFAFLARYFANHSHYVEPMDANWFKKQQRLAGVTAEDIAKAINKDRSAVSKIYSGQRRMSLKWAQAFASVLNVPLADVLAHAGELDEKTAPAVRIGLSEGEAAPFTPARPQAQTFDTIAQALGAKPGVDVWQVNTKAMCLAGLRPGDFMLVDTLTPDRAKDGDTVIAQNYDWKSGTATTVLRRFDTPVLLAASADPDEFHPLFVDNRNVVLTGKVIASWRVTT